MENHKSIYRIAWFFILLFVGISGYIGYFTVVERKEIAVHPYNKRMNHLEGEVVRGTLYDEEGIALAMTEEGKRIYPYGSMYSHVIGYSQRGKYGVEALANVELLYPEYTISSLFNYAFNGESFEGHDVYTSLNHDLQEAAAKGLGDRKGAVVVLEPRTGKIKAMYSSPAFNPNTIVEKWESLSEDTTNSPLVNRVTQGLYPPASTFKILTTLAYLEDESPSMTYTCTGKIEKNGHSIACYDKKAHGEVDLRTAFIKSCNTYFIALADEVSPKIIEEVGNELLFSEAIPGAFEVKPSQLKLDEALTFDTLASYIGQGKVLVTPFHMAMLASILYNDGVLMEPYIIEYAINNKGKESYKQLPQYVGAFMEEDKAHTMQALMEAVVKEGTARQLSRSDVRIGGKTGTAQNATGIDHSWFIGYAEDKEGSKEPISFAVIVEQGGRGAKALDVTNMLLSSYFD